MKKLLSIILTLVMILSTMCVSSFATKETLFNDISEHWAEGQIKRIADKGIISGYPDGTFKPDAPITRAEFAKIASVAFDLQVKSALNYDDVKPDDWYYSYLENCDMYIPIYALPVGYDNNIPYIDAQNVFLPNTPAMRMHIAEALVKIKMEQESISIDIPDISVIKADIERKFTDDDYENLYIMHGKVPVNVQRMFEYTWLASELEIMQGDDKGNFNPYGNVTRAELVTMIDRILMSDTNFSENKIESTENVSDKIRTSISEYYKNNQPKNDGDLKILLNKPFGNDKYLVLTEKYGGEGHLFKDLFLLNSEYDVLAFSDIEAPMSPCFSLGQIFYDGKTILFGAFDDSKYIPQEDKVVSVEINEICAELVSGNSIKTSVNTNKCFIEVLEGESEIKIFDLYNSKQELQATLDDGYVRNQVWYFVK